MANFVAIPRRVKKCIFKVRLDKLIVSDITCKCGCTSLTVLFIVQNLHACYHINIISVVQALIMTDCCNELGL